MSWRLMINNKDGVIEPEDAFVNMATDSAILESMQKNPRQAPTLRLYRWSPAAVSIGYFQSIADEVDLEGCDKHGTSVVRRITGGGAVYHDSEITYSFICDEKLAPKDIIASYELICGAVVKALRGLGIDAMFAPINDIVVGNKKISGSAQTRKQGVLLQHGTILLDVDVDRMFCLLKVPDEKIRDKMISAAKDRVTSVRSLMGSFGKHDENRLLSLIVDSFEDAFCEKFVRGDLSRDELELAKKAMEKFKSRSWNHMR